MTPGYASTVNLEKTTITTQNEALIPFTIEEYQRKRLLAELDNIDMTLLHADAIRSYEAARKQVTPWLF